MNYVTRDQQIKQQAYAAHISGTGFIGGDASMAAPKQYEIKDRLSRLSNAINSTNELANMLSNRLIPVMRSPVPMGACEAAMQSPVSTEFSGELHDMENRVWQIKNALEDALQRLEL